MKKERENLQLRARFDYSYSMGYVEGASSNFVSDLVPYLVVINRRLLDDRYVCILFYFC
jgi:hypothetical protein